ncbi:MAG: hypothetical protein KKD35_05110 [Elusimicrobia bacterium]|nr:hypothetical protein [Elusimicrobiota bacterium]
MRGKIICFLSGIVIVLSFMGCNSNENLPGRYQVIHAPIYEASIIIVLDTQTGIIWEKLALKGDKWSAWDLPKEYLNNDFSKISKRITAEEYLEKYKDKTEGRPPLETFAR